MPSIRTIEESIDIKAAPESVWRALTDPAEIARWFATSVTGADGVGNTLELRWGEQFVWPMVVRVWDPPKHVRLEDRYPAIATLDPSSKSELFIDYFIEPIGGGATRLRVVHSGFARDASWDGLYDSTSCGWRCEIAALKFYLERCAGRAREWVWVMREVGCSLDEAWGALMGDEGLALEPRAAATREGSSAVARWRSPRSEPVTVLRSKASRGAVLAPEAEGVMMMVNAEPPQTPGGPRVAMVRFNLYDGARSMAGALKQEWEQRLERMFG